MPATYPLADLLGTAIPLIQAPMAGSQLSPLAIASSNAGVLGSLPAAMLSYEALESELALLARGTSQPYNVNFFCHVPPAADAVREHAWRALLAPYYAEWGIDPSAVPAGAGRVPFTQEAADVLEEFRPAVVSFHFGLPADDLLARVKAWGSVVLSSATTLDEARWLEAKGVDAVIAQGVEAGGHRGMFLSTDLTTQRPVRELVPLFKQHLRVPIIAAGGIVTAKDVIAMRILGADGVLVGSAFLLATEAAVAAVHRTALRLAAGAPRDTAITNLFTGRPARGVVNRLMRERGPMSALPPAFPLAAAAIAPLRAAAEKAGSGDFSPLWCGAGGTPFAETGAAEIIAGLCEGF